MPTKYEAIKGHVLYVLGLSQERLKTYDAGFQLIQVDLKSGSDAILTTRDGSVLPSSPRAALAIIVDPTINRSLVRDWNSQNDIIAPVLEDGPEIPELLKFISMRLDLYALQIVELSSELAGLRMLHEDLQNGYASLRDLVGDIGLSRPNLFFSIDSEGHTSPASVTSISQSLPVEYHQIVAIGLEIAYSQTGERTAIEISLESPEDNELVRTWRIEAADLSPGWITLILDHDTSSGVRAANIRIQSASNTAGVPSFSLGAGVFQEHDAANVDGKYIGRPLAIKIWGSVAGAKPILTNEMVKPFFLGNAAIQQNEYVYDPDKTENFFGLLGDGGFEPVEVLGPQSLRVHPLYGSPVVARLDAACPRGTTRVQVDTETQSDQAAPVDYGLCLVPPDFSTARDRLEPIAFDDDTVWMRLPTGHDGQLTLELVSPTLADHDLFLITRMASGEPADFAWATFKRLVFFGNYN